MKKNIILTGMPGVGKSSMGVVLAKALGFHFVDSDLVIQQHEGKLLSEIIEEKGIQGFIETEDGINARLEAENTVIATGGSAVYGKNAMEHFKSIGKIVYLKAEYETIASRLSNLKGRGVVMSPGQSLRDLYDERCVLYERYADVIFAIDGLTIEETVAGLLKNL